MGSGMKSITDQGELSRLGAALGAIADLREEETLSLCREVVEAAFPDSVGHSVLEVLLHSDEPLRLIDIAIRCDRGKRSILPDGKVRSVVDRLAKVGVLVNLGTAEKPRYSLDKGDKRVQILRRMYSSIRYEANQRDTEAHTLATAPVRVSGRPGSHSA
jgi:hypothetical protein